MADAAGISTPKLFVTDLDGTLLRSDQTIHPRDLEALEAARERGVLVTLATGRLAGRTHPVARQLGLTLPIVCADGCLVACGATQRVLRCQALPRALIDAVLRACAEHDVASFVFTDEVIHSSERGRVHHAYLQGWSQSITTHVDLATGYAEVCAAMSAFPDGMTTALLAIGTADRIAAIEHALRDYRELADFTNYDGGVGQILRIVLKGASKGAAVAELARELGIAREQIAVAGDWWNDVSMFAFAGTSFAMPHAPAGVRAQATHALDHDVARDGAFADALHAWLNQDQS